MKAPLGRLSDIGWSMYDIQIGSSPRVDEGDYLLNISYLSYNFKLKDKVVEDFKLPQIKDIEEAFKNTSIMVDKGGVEVYDRYVDVGFEYKTMNGLVPDDIGEELDNVCHLLGFESYELNTNDIRFWYHDV